MVHFGYPFKVSGGMLALAALGAAIWFWPTHSDSRNIGWNAFSSFSQEFDQTNPARDKILHGWTTNCSMWPQTQYCLTGGLAAIGAPISEFDISLPIDFLVSRAGAERVRPHLAATILYDQNAETSLQGCRIGVPECRDIVMVSRSVRLVRAVWAEVSPHLPVVVFQESNIAANCADPDWPERCAAAERDVDVTKASSCNEVDAPWQAKPIDLGCFPHLLVTDFNRHSFRFSGSTGNPQTGNYMVLLAFHIMDFRPASKLSGWEMMTYWWQGKPTDSTLGVPCSSDPNCSRLGVPWRHFQMNHVDLPSDPKQVLTGVYNPYIEHPDAQQKNINCLVCHMFASSPTTIQATTSPSLGAGQFSIDDLKAKSDQYFLQSKATPTDQSWSLAFALNDIGIQQISKPIDPKAKH